MVVSPNPSTRLVPNLKKTKLRWGWIEWTLISNTMLPALLFIPGFTRIRILTRIGVYLVPMLAWLALGSKGKTGYFGSYKPSRWLLAGLAWSVLMLAHPGSDLFSGVAQICLTFSVICPAFWTEKAVDDPRRVPQCLAILLIGSSLSALVGIGQVLRPDLVPSPKNTVFSEAALEELKIEVNGQRIPRPQGLSDSPGGACLGGMLGGILGLAWSLRPISWWKKLCCLGCTFIGLAVIYFTQVRVTLLIWMGMTLVLMGLFFLQRDLKRLTQISITAASMFALSLIWVVATGGEKVMNRFNKLTESNIVTTYQSNRGGFVEESFNDLLPRAPLGMGVGRYGMMAVYFGDSSLPYRNQLDNIWVEVQITAWIVDGGAVLLFINFVALSLSLWNLFQIVMKARRKNEEIAFWAGVVFAMNAGIFVQCFGACPFVSVIGMQFWLFAAMIRAAARLDPTLRSIIA